MPVFRSNEGGTGDEQHHPHMMLALLLSCYSHGIFSSRWIERAWWKDVAVRYLCGNLNPDHDTIWPSESGTRKPTRKHSGRYCQKRSDHPGSLGRGQKRKSGRLLI
ncbi:MAG: transposase [Spirochaetales bacterium]|nr:transposase [Spirochaetales bacterium]